MSKIKRRIADWVFRNMTFPKKELEHGSEMVWMFKGNCPVCLQQPIEVLSNHEYHIRYPVNNTLTIGDISINLCDKHMNELIEFLNKEKGKHL